MFDKFVALSFDFFEKGCSGINSFTACVDCDGVGHGETIVGCDLD